MAPRTRKLIGTVVLLLFLAVYALVAMAVAISLEINTTSKWIELAFYAVAGLLWVVPAGFIVTWMSGGHDAAPDGAGPRG